MKTMKKLASMALALVMLMALTVPAMAVEQTGSITVKKAAKGETYYAYLLIPATVGGDGKISYDITAIKDGWDDYFTVTTQVTDDGTYTVVGLKSGVDFADPDVADALKALAGPAKAEVEATDVAVFTGLEPGYYLITRDGGTAVMIDSANNPTTIVYEKNLSDFNDGNVTKRHTNGTDDNVQIGDIVEYTVTINTVNYIGEGSTAQPVTSFEIDDDSAEGMLTSLTITSVKVNGADPVEPGSGTSFPYTLPWAEVDNETGEVTSYYNNDSTIVVTYTGVVSGTATGEIINTVTVTANNGNIPIGDGDDYDTIQTYTLTVNKVDGDENPLTGAQFNLKLNGEALDLIYDNLNGTYRIALEGEENTTQIIEAGSAVINGLDKDLEGQYTLGEIVAPDGYNLLTSDIDFEFETAEDGVNAEVDVVNQSGVELPDTGGIGTTIFTVAGGALMVGAAILFITKKRSTNG